jgi:exodeoxyribonuclease V alpha subunit
VSQQLGLGEVYLDLTKLAQQTEGTLGLTVTDDEQAKDSSLAIIKSYTLADWKQGLMTATVVGTGEGSSPLVLYGDRLYLRRYWQCQQIVNQAIQERVTPCRTGLPDALKAEIKALFSSNQQSPDWQKVACVIALRARFSIITGGPGTGKTTTLTRLLAILVKLYRIEFPDSSPLNILLAAPTGKAAARVSESINKAIEDLPVAKDIKSVMPTQASTLHRLLGGRHNTRQFRHHRNNPLVADIVIVDEASMIDLEMMAALLEALPSEATLILLGDKDQLASVEAGSVLGDLCQGAVDMAYDAETCAWIKAYAGEDLPINQQLRPNTGINQQTIMLLHSYRFGKDSGIGQLAKAVNLGDYISAQAILDNPKYVDLKPGLLDDQPAINVLSGKDSADRLLKQLVLANWGNNNNGRPNLSQGYSYYRALIKARPKDNQPELIDAWATQVLKGFDTFRVLCALRKGPWGVEGLNERIEHWLIGEHPPQLWYEGRPVMITSNDYTLGLMNGDIGIALRDHTDKLRVVFPAGEGVQKNGLHWVSPLRLPNVETAYAMTVHKSQGSEFNHVALVLPETLNRVLTRELIYTGITRSKENFSLIETQAGVFTEAIKVSCVN